MARLALGLQNRRDVLRECHLGRGLLRERSARQCEECADGDSQVELRTMHHLAPLFLLSYSNSTGPRLTRRREQLSGISGSAESVSSGLPSVPVDKSGG